MRLDLADAMTFLLCKPQACIRCNWNLSACSADSQAPYLERSLRVFCEFQSVCTRRNRILRAQIGCLFRCGEHRARGIFADASSVGEHRRFSRIPGHVFGVFGKKHPRFLRIPIGMHTPQPHPACADRLPVSLRRTSGAGNFRRREFSGRTSPLLAILEQRGALTRVKYAAPAGPAVIIKQSNGAAARVESNRALVQSRHSAERTQGLPFRNLDAR